MAKVTNHVAPVGARMAEVQKELDRDRTVLDKAQSELLKRQATAAEAKLSLDEVVLRRPKLLAEAFAGGGTSVTVLDKEGILAEAAAEKATKALADQQAVVAILGDAVAVATQAVAAESSKAKRAAADSIKAELAAIYVEKLRPLYAQLAMLNHYPGLRNEDFLPPTADLIQRWCVQFETFTGIYPGSHSNETFFADEIEKLVIA